MINKDIESALTRTPFYAMAIKSIEEFKSRCKYGEVWIKGVVHQGKVYEVAAIKENEGKKEVDRFRKSS